MFVHRTSAEAPIENNPPAPELKVISYTPEFERIAVCESRNDPLAKNPHSSAKGRFQFLNGSWKYYGQKLWGDKWTEKNVLDYDDNTELAWYVYTTYGPHDWDESSYCWKK